MNLWKNSSCGFGKTYQPVCDNVVLAAIRAVGEVWRMKSRTSRGLRNLLRWFLAISGMQWRSSIQPEYVNQLLSVNY